MLQSSNNRKVNCTVVINTEYKLQVFNSMVITYRLYECSLTCYETEKIYMEICQLSLLIISIAFLGCLLHIKILLYLPNSIES